MKKIVIFVQIIAAIILLLASIRAMALSFGEAMTQVEAGKKAYLMTEPGFLYVKIDTTCVKNQLPAGFVLDKIAVGRTSPKDKVYLNWIPTFKSLMSDEWEVKP